MRVFHFVIKKKKKEKGPETDLLFFKWFWHFFKSIWILIITSVAIHYSQNVFRGYSILVYIGVQVFFRGFFLFFSPPLARDPLSPSPRAYLRLTEKGWKIAPVLQIQASSMKLMVYGFLFLGFLHIKTDGKNKLFF